jgi:NTF2 fold immunity protein
MKNTNIILTIFLFLMSHLYCFGQRTLKDAIEQRNFYSEANYMPDSGYVKNQSIATKIATIVLEAIYGESMKRHIPLEAFLVDDDTIWIVIGKKNKGVKGGTPYVEIRKKDGLILKVAHSK